ncbi:MAG: hypothetical protein RLZZ516_2450 [Cyanobacteriota bacterium]|jgi:hypothetical protein
MSLSGLAATAAVVVWPALLAQASPGGLNPGLQLQQLLRQQQQQLMRTEPSETPAPLIEEIEEPDDGQAEPSTPPADVQQEQP